MNQIVPPLVAQDLARRVSKGPPVSGCFGFGILFLMVALIALAMWVIY